MNGYVMTGSVYGGGVVSSLEGVVSGAIVSVFVRKTRAGFLKVFSKDLVLSGLVATILYMFSFVCFLTLVFVDLLSLLTKNVCFLSLGRGYGCRSEPLLPFLKENGRFFSWLVLPVFYVALLSIRGGSIGIESRCDVVMLVITLVFKYFDKGYLSFRFVDFFIFLEVLWGIGTVFHHVLFVSKRFVVSVVNFCVLIYFCRLLEPTVILLLSFTLLCFSLFVKFRFKFKETGSVLRFKSASALGGLRVSGHVHGAVSEVWKVVSSDGEWPVVRMQALKGDCLLKLLLSTYVADRGGGVSKVSDLGQAFLSDGALVNYVRVYHAEWWANASVSMHGKSAATLVEATWGILWNSLVVDLCMSVGACDRVSLDAAFACFICEVAKANGCRLDRLDLYWCAEGANAYVDTGVSTVGSSVTSLCGEVL